MLFLYLPKFYFLHFCKYTPKIATNGILAGKSLTSSGGPKEPDLDPVFIACYCFCGGLAFSRFSAVLSEQRKCFCFALCSSSDEALLARVRSVYSLASPQSEFRQASVLAELQSVDSKAFCLPFDKPLRASNWLFFTSQSLTEENILGWSTNGYVPT